MKINEGEIKTMKCAFINEDFSIDYKELEKDATLELCLSNKYFSISLNDEYYIFIPSNIYNDKNIDKIAPLMITANKELMFLNN